jgi:1,4-alpha-glucan branching enzyme
MWLSECHVDGFRWDTPDTMMHGNDGSYIPAADSLIYAINTMIHYNYTGKISIAEDVYNYDGFDSAWDTTFPGTVTTQLAYTPDSSRDMSVIANAVQYNVRYGGTAGTGRVAFLESHDVVGNGVRLVTAIDSVTPNSYWARKRSTLGAAVTLTAPGIPMIFQGQEMLENQHFSTTNTVDWSKTNTYSYIVQLYRDLINARRNLKGYTPGLEGDQCSMLQVDNINKLVAFHRWTSAAPNQDAVVIANFANDTLNNYNLNFPSAGNWYVQFNSDSTNYGPDYGNIGSSVVTASGSPATASITIGPYSALILSQVPNVSPTLTITQTNDIATISWLNSYSGWVLDSSVTLAGNPPPWNQVSSSQYQTNSTMVFINITPSGDATFYRLRKP